MCGVFVCDHLCVCVPAGQDHYQGQYRCCGRGYGSPAVTEEDETDRRRRQLFAPPAVQPADRQFIHVRAMATH